MKKESLSIMTVKTLLAVIIFAGMGTIIIGGGYIIWEYGKNGTANQITKPADQETENYYDALEKKCDDGKCCLRSLKIMKENNYKEIDQNGKCPEGFEESFLPLKGIAGFCENSLKWCQPIQTKIISIKTDKIEYFTGEQVKIAIKNETDGIMYIPEYITIERFYDNKWEGIVRRTCPWDRLSYNDGYYFEAHSNNIYDWNQEERGCDMSKFMTYHKQVIAGKYRVKIPRSIREEERNKEEIIYSNEFTIREKENYCVDEENNRREIGEIWSESPTMFMECNEFGSVLSNYVLSCGDEKLIISNHGSFDENDIYRTTPLLPFFIATDYLLKYTWIIDDNKYPVSSGGPVGVFTSCENKKAEIFYFTGLGGAGHTKIFFDSNDNSITEIYCVDSSDEFYRENNPENFIVRKLEDGKRLNNFKPLENGKEICQEIKERYQELKETVIDTSDWQTYRNEEFGFEVKYPEEFLTKIEKVPVLQIFKNGKIEILHKIEFIDPQESNSVSITVHNNGNNYLLDQWLKKYKETNPVGAGLSKEKKIVVNGAEGLKGEFGCCSTYQNSVFLKNREKIYQIAGDYFDIIETRLHPNEDIFNQILSTFKFIEN